VNEIVGNCNLSPMTFSINLPIVLSRTIGQKVLRKSYNFLLSLGIIMDVETLKCDGQ